MTAAPPTKVEIASAALMQFLVNNMTPDGEPPDEWLVDILWPRACSPASAGSTTTCSMHWRPRGCWTQRLDREYHD